MPEGLDRARSAYQQARAALKRITGGRLKGIAGRVKRGPLVQGPLTANELILAPIVRTNAPSHYLSIVACAKNEARYLEEWIDFHRVVGCSHFFIYNNGSSDVTGDILTRYESKGILTQIPWPDFVPWTRLLGCSCQVPAYAHALSAFGALSRWMMFIDIDEFVFPAEGDDLKTELASFEDLPALALPWHMFGPSGHKTDPSGLLIENYTQRAALPTKVRKLLKYKSVVDPTRVRTPGTHRFVLDEGPVVYTQQRNALRDPDWKFLSPSQNDRIILNHYYTKSEAEFQNKTVQVKAGQKSRAKRRRERLSAIEESLVEDRRIQRFVPKLKALQWLTSDAMDQQDIG